jgi:putative acetyltransferase
MTFRLATAADVPTLAALYGDTARALGGWCYSPEQVAAWASFGEPTPAFADYVLHARTWVAMDAAGGVLGFCGVGEPGPEDGEVHSLYVRAELTRQGWGSRLLAHALAEARGRGLQRFAAWATPFSCPVFERAGFRLVETVSAPYQGVVFTRYRMQA